MSPVFKLSFSFWGLSCHLDNSSVSSAHVGELDTAQTNFSRNHDSLIKLTPCTRLLGLCARFLYHFGPFAKFCFKKSLELVCRSADQRQAQARQLRIDVSLSERLHHAALDLGDDIRWHLCRSGE